LDFLEKVKPRVFILENVSGLKKIQGGKYMNAILKELNDLGCYNVQWKILNTKEQGVPHSRNRWYCVGILKEFDTKTFTFPEPISCPSIELFLEERSQELATTGLPPKTAKTATTNVKSAHKSIRRTGSNPFKKTYIVDCDSSPSRSKFLNGICPCLTVSRGNGHWVTSRGRRLSKEEMMRLQGMNPTTFKVAVSETQLGRQLGNTMSVNVLERLFVRLLPAAKLARASDLTDRWETGQAVKELARTRGLGFKVDADEARSPSPCRVSKRRARSMTPPRPTKRRALGSPSKPSLK